jgi:Tfp pilus assembly protein PilZ
MGEEQDFKESSGESFKGETIVTNEETPQTMKDMEWLEKQDWQLWLLAISLILLLTLFTGINYYGQVHGSSHEFFQQIAFLDTYIVGFLILIPIACIYIVRKNLHLRRLRKQILGQRIKMQPWVETLEGSAAISQISAMISAHKDLPAILEAIVRESLQGLKAQRSSIFLLDGKSGILKSQYTYAPNPLDEQVSLFEEKEMARKAIKQISPLLLREPKDFVDFFKYEGRERKITSLLCMPLAPRGQAVGALSVVLINGGRSFSEKDLQFLSIYSNHASIAIENTQLQEEARKGDSLRRSYEGYLDDIISQLQNLSEEERARIEEHIKKLMQGQRAGERPFIEPRIGKEGPRGEGEVPLAGEFGIHRAGQDDRPEGGLRVEFADSSLSLADDLTLGGVFIRTPNPMELGEQFVLKLHMSDGAEPIEVACKVIWTNKYGQESKNLRRGMGVKFLNLPDEVKKRVEEQIRSQKKEHFFKDRRGSAAGMAGERKKPKGAG